LVVFASIGGLGVQRFSWWFAVVATGWLAACSITPRAGPQADEAIETLKQPVAAGSVQIVNVDASVVRSQLARRHQETFSETLANGEPAARPMTIGAGDVLDVTLWEAPPATLFGNAPIDPRNPSTVRSTTLPEQVVDQDGSIRVPFAGSIKVRGLTLEEVQAEIVQRLRGKANQPEALVRFTRGGSSTVTVVGEVTNSIRLPLTPARERLLDALAAAGGVRQPVHRMTLQVTRGKDHHSMPMDLVIRDPRQNVPLRAGDVLTAIHQPLNFTVLGAAGKNEEIAFEAQGISLAQALGRVGGLNDARADPQGVFIFRFESANALDWPRQPTQVTPDGRVPVVYRVNLADARNYFLMQGFQIQDRDVLYVSNASSVELQKFLNLLFSVAYPVLNTIELSR
jgi:polysaccharide export outer membrane protein